MFNAETCLVLTNAVYFKSSWSAKFDSADNTQQKFHLSPGHDETVTMLNQTDSFILTQAPGVKILSIPYQGDASLVVILPNAPYGLHALEANFSAATLDNWLASSQFVPVQLALPEFTETSQFDVNDVLKKLGMKQAFTPAANFTGIASVPGQPLYISDILHKAHIGVDENGTEAAAATAVVMALSAMAPPPPGSTAPPPIPFIADHPFLYLIRANSTGAILFMGRVQNPMQP